MVKRGDVDIRLTRNGPRALRRSGGVAADLVRRASNVAAAAGAGFETSSRDGTNRARASVVTANADAMRAQATNRTLTRAIDAGRR